MLRSEGEQDSVFCGSRLQLEIELPAEAFAQRESPCAIDAAAEWRVQHELHAARFIEKALDDDRVLRRHGAESGVCVPKIRNDFVRCYFRDSGFVHQVLRCPFFVLRAAFFRRRRTKNGERFPQITHCARQLVASRRRLAEPERNVWRRAVRVRYAHNTASDLQDLPRRVAELEDVAGHALDREVLVEGADECIVRLEQHAIVGHFGNRSSRGNRQHSRSAASSNA